MKPGLRKLTLSWTLGSCLLLPMLSHAEKAVQSWVQTYMGPNGFSRANSLVVDRSNNVIVTGYSTENGPGCYITIKYSGAGVPLWTNRYDRGYSASPGGIAVDGADNIIVTGTVYMDATGWDCDFATIKYSSDGIPLWTNRYNGPAGRQDGGSDVTVDGGDNIIVTGSSGWSVTGEGGSFFDWATIKYSSTGALLWVRRYNGPGDLNDGAVDVVTDGNGDVVVTGHSDGAGTQSDYTTIKYSGAGLPLWTNRYNGRADGVDYAAAIAVDSANNVFVTGESDVPNSYSSEYVTIKYSGVGVPLWTNFYMGTQGADNGGRAIAVDSGDNVIVTGYSWGYGLDFMTLKYSGAGSLLWGQRYNGPGNSADAPYAVCIDSNNNVIVAGYCSQTYSYESRDYATIKYSSAGSQLWVECYNGPGDGYDEACALAVDHRNNVIVTGSAAGDSWGGGRHFVTAKYAVPTTIKNFTAAGESFQMALDKTPPCAFVVEVSTDLSAWAPLFTNNIPTNQFLYTDPGAGPGVRRFYRVLSGNEP